MSNDLGEIVFSITIKHGFIYVVTSHYLYVLNRNNMKVQTVYKLTGTPVKIKFFPVTKKEIELFKENDKQIFVTKIIFGYSNRLNLSWSSIYHTINEETNEEGKTDSKSSIRLINEGELTKHQEFLASWLWRRPFNRVLHVSSKINSVDINNTLAV